MGLIKEFKAFALRGNVMDMAVGVIIGSAFGKVVSSVVSDVLMPPIGKLTGNVDFSNLYVLLSQEEKFQSLKSLKELKDAGAATINYGLFVNTLIDFTIVAFVVFLLVKGINTLHRKEAVAPAPPAPPAEPPAEVKLLAEIRDLLKTGKTG
jgi:large conductance mechanosensitive channel